MSSQGSRLEQIQMRYQQKLMSGNEQRKSEALNETQKLLTSSLGAGKVRAMFDERRHRINAGIDKSYLLDPISVETKTTTTKGVIAPAKAVRLDHKISNYSKVIVPPLQNRYKTPDVTSNSNGVTSSQEDDSGKSRLSKKVSTSSVKTNPRIGSTSKVAPVTTSPSALKNLTNQTSPTRSTKSGSSIVSSANTTRTIPKPGTGNSSRSITPKYSRTSASSSSKNENSPQSSFDDDDAPVPEGLVKCGICKRNFAEDRIEKHRVICQKTKTKKRKIFDASKKRVQGTEAESYLRKPVHRSSKTVTTTSTATTPKSSNWRSKHEDFIKTIRAAKEMKAFLAKGGKLSDLPPPPPSENPDYVQCPHCSRRFNEAAANRHIPICQNMQHNKPKPKVSAGKMTNSIRRR